MNTTTEAIVFTEAGLRLGARVSGGSLTVLAGNLQRACKAVRLPGLGAHPYPILTHVLLTASGAGGGTLGLVATDREDWLESDPIPCRMEGPDFSVCVPAATLRDWVSIESAGAQIHIDYEPGIEMLYLTAGNARAEIKCMSSAEFPAKPEEIFHKVKRPTFATLCKQALRDGYTHILGADGETTPLLVVLRKPRGKLTAPDYWARDPENTEPNLTLFCHNRPGGYVKDSETGEWVPETENQDPDGWHVGGYYKLITAPVTIDEVTEPAPDPEPEKNVKRFYIQSNIGKARYVVNFHDGIKKHDDGSDFYDIEIFKSKKALGVFVQKLRNEGYTE